MQAYCKQHHFEIVETYIDEAKSATTDRRPAFQQMVSDSAAHTFDILLVHKLDRFARNRYDSAVYKRELKKNGVTVYSVLENLDNSPESIMMEAVLEGMSEYYSQNLAREVMKGLRETALQCKHTGGKPPLGYDVDTATRQLVINPEEADTVRIIFDMYSKGYGYSP
jgi:site-specific DNA recombinase